MTSAYPTRIETRSANAMAQRLADDSADALCAAANIAVDYFARGLAHARYAGAAEAELDLIRDTILDCISGIQGRINRTLEDASQHQIDASELTGGPQ